MFDFNFRNNVAVYTIVAVVFLSVVSSWLNEGYYSRNTIAAAKNLIGNVRPAVSKNTKSYPKLVLAQVSLNAAAELMQIPDLEKQFNFCYETWKNEIYEKMEKSKKLNSRKTKK